ncbi:unnamed protein product [Urochloa decumbens]|uniref:Uncharacterized protein n=1 Tax=Urochloa decumbens TaxID=240449 RepID=A0ABC9AT55_9POAL
MRSLLGKLGSLLAQEYTLISGVRSEIQYMNNELSSMHAFLRKLGRAAADGATHDEQTKDWIEQVRDVAYDIEDCVDDFAHLLGHQPRGEGITVNLRRAWYTMTTLWMRQDIASKIIDLKNRAQEVGERRTSYFLFIDDVWSVSSWQKISESLPKNQKGSIVVTTRFKSVANACCRQQEHIYTVTPLSLAESAKLFFERIHDPEPENFKKTKDEIIRKCGGLPLALVAVAGLLARRDLTEESHWETVKESLKSELDKNLSIEGVTQILNLCYNDLPADQKNCLLYLSIFPKGCSINRKRLIRRWISEGFITEKDGKTVEEVAEDSFDELISRNIVRPVEHNTNGKVKTCQVHDMILEYIVFKSSEENFITVVGGHWLTPTPSNKVRRLSLHNSNSEDVKEKIENMNLSHVRSLTVFENLHHLPPDSFNLRDLHTNTDKYKELLPTIEHLSGYSLKSLAIDDGFTGFLHSMDDLSSPPKYLLSLDLSGKLLRVPKWIKELETLEKLTLSLTSLQTDGLQVLSKLSKLFSLTFSINAKGQDSNVVEILQKNAIDSGGKIFVPADGFASLKLLRFSAPVMPLLNFLEGAMPELQRLELQFRLSEGVYDCMVWNTLKISNKCILESAGRLLKLPR